MLINASMAIHLATYVVDYRERRRTRQKGHELARRLQPLEVMLLCKIQRSASEKDQICSDLLRIRFELSLQGFQVAPASPHCVVVGQERVERLSGSAFIHLDSSNVYDSDRRWD